MLMPSEIKKLLPDSPHANIMTMIIYLINSGGEERFESWYNLNSDLYDKIKQATDYYSLRKPHKLGIKWDEDSQQFVSRDEWQKKKVDKLNEYFNTLNKEVKDEQV